MRGPLAHLGITIDYNLHKQAKIKAIEEGLSLSVYIEKLIREDLDKKKNE